MVFCITQSNKAFFLFELLLESKQYLKTLLMSSLVVSVAESAEWKTVLVKTGWSLVASYGKGESVGLKTVFGKKGKVSFENTFITSSWYMGESTCPYSLNLDLLGLSFSAKNKGFLMLLVSKRSSSKSLVIKFKSIPNSYPMCT